MRILEEYALLKMKIKELEDKCREIAPEIKKILEGEEEMKLKQDFGTFSIVKRIRLEYDADFEEMIKNMRKVQQEQKNVKEIYTEELRFTSAKTIVPRGAYKFPDKLL